MVFKIASNEHCSFKKDRDVGILYSLESVIRKMILYRMCERSRNNGVTKVVYNLVCKCQQNILVCLLNKIELIFLSAAY